MDGSSLLFRVILLTVATKVIALSADDADPTTSTTQTATTTLRLSTSTTTTSAGVESCGGVTRCLNDTQCARCLSAINATRGFPHTNSEFYSKSVAAQRAYQVGCFETLLSTVSCSTNATPPGILHPALIELGGSCGDIHGMVDGNCLVTEYACFVNPDCRPYFAALYSSDGNGKKAEEIHSLATHAAAAIVKDLANNCAVAFPKCTFIKQQCANSSECLRCLETFGTGDGGEAARQCSGTTTSALLLDNVVDVCTENNAATCSFWSQRCADNVKCSACLAVMNNRESALAVAADWSTLACQRAAQDVYAVHYIQTITFGCPAISLCQQAVANCVVHNGAACISCLNGSAPPSQAATCSFLRQQSSYDTACQSCSDSVHTITVIVLITTVVGGASAIVCVAVAATIVARGYSRVSMWHRIVVGLMLSNAVYSTANAIPLNALRTDVIDCGRLAMSFDTIRAGRAWWFCGKYGLVSFELFILGASIRALLVGSSAVPPWAEAAMHAACWTCAFAAFVVFYLLCSSINTSGYNSNTENVAYTDMFDHGDLNDDLDDETPYVAASLEFEHGRAEYDNLVRDMLLAWDTLVGMAVVLWVVLRLMYLHALRMLLAKVDAAARAEAADVWAETRRSAWAARRRLLEARKEAFNEVAKPLEPYIAVFVVFAAPAIVMSTSWCQAHSGANSEGVGSTAAGNLSTNFSYGKCDVWCEFVLAFRSLATVAVYLIPRERRIELVSVRTTWRKLLSRVVVCVCCRSTQLPCTQVDRVGHEGTYEMLELAQEPPINRNNYDDNGETVNTLTEHFNENDVIKVRRLGQGAFGEVWEGMLRAEGRRVAIKTLFAGAVDEDGDIIDPVADQDFRKECAVLQRIDSPHLIKFFGFGTTESGNGFIVTELMDGGSLEGLLHNRECDVPWRTRVSFGLQIALGMDHLHQRHMLHRDLKSANVLVNAQLTIAKVCDFGLSRVVKPTQRHVVSYSPFTGVTRLLPRIDSVEISNVHDVLSLSDIAVSIEDARGNMTKAVGTLRWMAPEVFRGDRNYTDAVDVYSFGVVLWELATRKTPWTEIDESGTKTVFFLQLNLVLQTGRRPNVPVGVSAEHGGFIAVMTRCWAGDPTDRPTFSEAARDLAALLRSYALE